MKIINELKTKNGTFKLGKSGTDYCIFGFEEEESKTMESMVIASPLAQLIGELFDFMKAQQQE